MYATAMYVYKWVFAKLGGYLRHSSWT